MRIVYSPDFKDNLVNLKKYLSLRFGAEKKKEVISKIRESIESLKENPLPGVSLSALYGIETDCRYLFVAHNYIFYEHDDDVIRIINIYNEREDFMYLLFGIPPHSTESEEYWGE